MHTLRIDEFIDYKMQIVVCRLRIEIQLARLVHFYYHKILFVYFLFVCSTLKMAEEISAKEASPSIPSAQPTHIQQLDTVLDGDLSGGSILDWSAIENDDFIPEEQFELRSDATFDPETYTV